MYPATIATTSFTHSQLRFANLLLICLCEFIFKTGASPHIKFGLKGVVEVKYVQGFGAKCLRHKSNTLDFFWLLEEESVRRRLLGGAIYVIRCVQS